MPALANVLLTNTFDEWRTRTNQIIVKLDQLETANIRVVSNSSVIQITNPDVTLSNTVWLTSNALATTGGAITGNLSVSGNITTGNLIVTTNSSVPNIYVSGNVFTSNIVVSNDVTITGDLILL